MKHWTHAPLCLNLENIVQSEISQAQKATQVCDSAYMEYLE